MAHTRGGAFANTERGVCPPGMLPFERSLYIQENGDKGLWEWDYSEAGVI